MFESQPVLSQQLPDFVDLAFARRLEMAETVTLDCVAALREYSPGQPIAADVVAGGVAFYGGPNYPSNQMVGMGLYGEVTAGDLDCVEEFFQIRGVPSCHRRLATGGPLSAGASRPTRLPHCRVQLCADPANPAG